MLKGGGPKGHCGALFGCLQALSVIGAAAQGCNGAAVMWRSSVFDSPQAPLGWPDRLLTGFENFPWGSPNAFPTPPPKDPWRGGVQRALMEPLAAAPRLPQGSPNAFPKAPPEDPWRRGVQRALLEPPAAAPRLPQGSPNAFPKAPPKDP
eukprot:684584-Pyramimonas_sp.AAC.1